MAVGIGQDIIAVLRGLSAVTALVGSGTSARIYEDNAPRETTAAHIIVEVDGDRSLNDLTGKGGLRISDVNLICRSASRVGADALAEAVRTNGTNPGTGLAGYAGATFDSVWEAVAAGRSPKGDASAGWWYDANVSLLVIASEAQ